MRRIVAYSEADEECQGDVVYVMHVSLQAMCSGDTLKGLRKWWWGEE